MPVKTTITPPMATKKTSLLRILFMGTPQFALPSLAALHNSAHKVVAVWTAPDKPQGRGQRLGASVIKDWALEHKVPCHQPTNLQAPSTRTLLEEIAPDLIVVVAFRKLPATVADFPSHGSINLHASLLPAYRGAAPIHWALIRGESQTGVTTIRINERIDEGPVLFQEATPIAPDDNAATLHDRLAQQGADLLLKTVHALAASKLPGQAQATLPLATHSKAPKLHTAMCQINWHESAENICNFVRGLAPYPGAWAELNGHRYKILALEKIDHLRLSPAQLKEEADALFIGTATHAVSVLTLQPAGRKVMSIQSYLRGKKA